MITSDEIKENYSKISHNVESICKRLKRPPASVRIIPVSKTHPAEVIKLGHIAGLNIFAENYAREIRDKHKILDELGIAQPEWHFVGHLQTNKVKYVAPFVKLIHSVDSAKLGREINKQALKSDRVIDILIQVHTSGEESKFGCPPGGLPNLFEELLPLENIRIRGLMTIAGLWGNKDQVRSEFMLLHDLKDRFNQDFGINMAELSMGMTGDYEMAIEEGSSMIRIGTAIFGRRG